MLSKQTLNEFYNALSSCSTHGNNRPLKIFKDNHPEDFSLISSVYHKRCAVGRNLEAMESTNNKVYFCTLTFNDENNDRKEENKRKQAWRFLNNIFEFVLMVEEYGENNGRYHLHLFGTFKNEKTFNDFFAWYETQNVGRCDIKTLTKRNKKKLSKYVCDYTIKQAPRIRRNKRLVALEKSFKRSKTMNNYGFTYYENVYKAEITELIDLPF